MINSILRFYDVMNFNNFRVINVIAYIRYLYRFLSKNHSNLIFKIRFVNQYHFLFKKGQYLYFLNQKNNYISSNFFKQDEQFSGHPIHYIHEDYQKAVDPETIHHGRQWMRWLEEVVGVRRIPELGATGGVLSKEFQYIVDYQSNKLLGTLKRGWDSYRPLMLHYASEELRSSAVLLEHGRRIPLRRTFLPFPKLKRIAAELHIADAYPFIAIFELLQDEGRLEWMFVKEFGVGIEENLDFYLTALESFKQINPALSTISERDQLTRIYKNIQSRCSEDLDHVWYAFVKYSLFRD